METVAPEAAIVGVNAVTVGVAIKVKPASVAVPAGFVIDTLPVAPAAATTAVILVALTLVTDVAAVPPKLTAVVPVRLVPVMVI